MGYPLREEIEGAYYHVGTRGNNQRDIYSDDASRLLFLRMLQQLAKKYQWSILAYCLMNNHYHLALRLDSGGLSRGMQALNGGYALTFNAREGRRDQPFDVAHCLASTGELPLFRDLPDEAYEPDRGGAAAQSRFVEGKCKTGPRLAPGAGRGRAWDVSYRWKRSGTPSPLASRSYLLGMPSRS